MYRWLKRRAEISLLKQMNDDLDRFLLGLKGGDNRDVACVVATAAHIRNNILRDDGVDLLQPLLEESRDPMLAWKMNKLYAQAQKEAPDLAAGVAVWVHTLRAANTPELRLKGRMMWAELARGFPFVETQADDFRQVTGYPLKIEGYESTPNGLEPNLVK